MAQSLIVFSTQLVQTDLHPETMGTPQKANAFIALLAFLFHRQRYIELAIKHAMAIKLIEEGALEAYKRGELPQEGWQEKTRKQSIEFAKHLDRNIWMSFSAIASCSVISLLICYLTGKIGEDLPASPEKIIGFIGAFLAAWSTLMELGGTIRTYSGEALHEKVHPFLFGIMFVPGTFLALLSLLW